MPSYVVKPDKDKDEYVVWSTIVDSVTWFGSAEELMYDNPEVTRERIDRADLQGTSAYYGKFCGYSELEFVCQNIDKLHDEVDFVLVNRENLYEYSLATYEENYELAETLCSPFYYED